MLLSIAEGMINIKFSQTFQAILKELSVRIQIKTWCQCSNIKTSHLVYIPGRGEVFLAGLVAGRGLGVIIPVNIGLTAFCPPSIIVRNN